MKNLVIFLVLAVTASAVWAEDPVYFADENLKAAVEAELGVADPTPTDMLGLTSLTASYSGIVDLTGLEYAINLTTFDLGFNNIIDISALSGLSSLIHIDLYYNNISDISALSELTNLSYLNLNHNGISNISSLSGLSNLTQLYIYHNGISDISALEGLSSLTDLNLQRNNISDISSLSGLNNLTKLHLNQNKISDITALSGLNNLEQLNLNENFNISNISGLSGLSNLRQLYLGNNNISDISALSELTNLGFLYLHYNNISDVTGLAGLSSLRILYLSYNNISDITGLAGLNNLRSLYLHRNNISDISALSGLTSLSGLYLSNNTLNCPAYDVYIPMIEDNNPGIYLIYDPMPPECENEPPVADAGEDDRVAIGDTVWLDGSDSYDPEGNPLTYLWSFVSIPLGSGAMIDDPTAVQTFFMPDLFGDYVVSLVVNDGTVDSDPDTVTITAIPPDQAAAETLVEMEEIIQLIPPENLHNDNAATPLTKKIEATLTNIANGSYQDALTKLQDDILKKTDGCALTGAPDSTDWLLKCEDQAEVYPLVMRAIELLESLIQ